MICHAADESRSICSLFCGTYCCRCSGCFCFKALCRPGCTFRGADIADCSLPFGNLEMNVRILERNFGSKRFLIKEGGRVPQVDAMFFPATEDEVVEVEPASPRQYQEKATIIMSNPNALIYQWYVLSVNAYWLDFFLRRECNVLVWNYRNYGASEESLCSPYHDPN